MKDPTYPNWFLWIWEHGVELVFVFLLIAIVVTVAFGYYTKRRLDDIEDRLTYAPPRQYEPLNVDAHAAAEISPDDMAVQKTVYVPVYSHIYCQQGRPYLLETTLSVRNTDRKKPIYVRSVDYFDTQGELVKQYIDRLIRLRPLETIEFLVEAQDTKGGSGANFLVQWVATEMVDEPMVEAVMVGIAGTQAISFSRSGRVLSQTE